LFLAGVLLAGSGCGFNPSGTWTLTAPAQATATVTYQAPDEVRAAAIGATALAFSPVAGIPATTGVRYDAGRDAVTTRVGPGGMVEISLDAQHRGSTVVETITEMVPETSCEQTRTVTVSADFTDDGTAADFAIVQDFALETTTVTCTHPASLCTCGQVVAFGMGSGDGFWSVLAATLTSGNQPLADSAMADALAQVRVEYPIAGARSSTTIPPGF
jgi:hypothetical protein